MRWIYWLGWMAFGAAFRTLFGMKIVGGENLITEGPVLVASNHESFLDPPLIGNLYKTEMVLPRPQDAVCGTWQMALSEMERHPGRSGPPGHGQP